MEWNGMYWIYRKIILDFIYCVVPQIHLTWPQRSFDKTWINKSTNVFDAQQLQIITPIRDFLTHDFFFSVNICDLDDISLSKKKR